MVLIEMNHKIRTYDSISWQGHTYVRTYIYLSDVISPIIYIQLGEN